VSTGAEVASSAAAAAESITSSVDSTASVAASVVSSAFFSPHEVKVKAPAIRINANTFFILTVFTLEINFSGAKVPMNVKLAKKHPIFF
jgi:hypothetical protein